MSLLTLRRRQRHEYGVVRAEMLTATEMREYVAAGSRWFMVQAFWERLQSAQGAALSSSEVTALTTQITNIRAAGGKVLFEASLHYPPTWVGPLLPKFKAQDATFWTGGVGSGEEVYDWVFSQTGRTLVADFITKLGAQFGSQIDGVRVGGLKYNELMFPPDGYSGTLASIRYWGYSTAAVQGGAGLATGMVACPLPSSYLVFGAGSNDTDDQTWIAWYLDALTRFMSWQLDRWRLVTSAPLWVLHPSWGVRQDRSLPTNKLDVTYRRELAIGTDAARQMTAYQARANVWPWCTWLEDVRTPPWANDSAKPPWAALYDLAQARGKTRLIWGENSGGVDNTAMDRIFAAGGAIPYGYRGVVWINDDSLTDGTSDTRANLFARIATRP